MLVVAGLSDGIDGLLARKLNQRSSLGAYLDPIADKLLLSSSFIILAFKQKIAWWLTIIVLSRDTLILIVAVVILLISGYRPFPPSIFGKLTTLFEIVLVFTVVLDRRLSPSAFGCCHHAFDLHRPRFRDLSALQYSFAISRPPHDAALVTFRSGRLFRPFVGLVQPPNCVAQIFGRIDFKRIPALGAYGSSGSQAGLPSMRRNKSGGMDLILKMMELVALSRGSPAAPRKSSSAIEGPHTKHRARLD